MKTYPLTVQITTRDGEAQREVLQEYVLLTRHPRWQLFKIFWHAMTHIKFRS